LDVQYTAAGWIIYFTWYYPVQVTTIRKTMFFTVDT
jgi:hypothetical protein